MPSLENASNTLTPNVTARVSLRVAPGQSSADALKALTEHIERNTPFGAEILITDVNLGESFSADTNGWASQAYGDALKASWGVSAVNMGVGGSIPFISSFVQAFPHAQVLVTGVEDPDSRAHSPNESLHIDSFKKAIEAELRFLLACNSASV